MKKVLKIGIIGCGAIGTSLAEFIRTKLRGKAVVCCVYDIDRSKALRLSKKLRLAPSCVTGSREVLIRKSGLVVEAASAACSLDIAVAAVSEGKDVMVMSVGGIVAGIGKLREKARREGCRVYVPSGAISGVDAAKAAAIAGIRTSSLTTRKPPQSFASVAYVMKKNIDLGALRGDTVLFRGSAEEAMRYFPQNINVAGVLSLAGAGPVKTKVSIVASPGISRNTHAIEIVSDAGHIVARTENVIHPDNPKTSFLAVLSAAAMISQIVDPLWIGT